MRRKLRIFSHIAIICLSVCMFAFGVYAASTVSVTTSGTVTFNASGVYAKITRTVTGAKVNPNNIEQTIDASATENQNFKMGENESLEFIDATTPIVMTFTIENLASDRNLDFIVINNSESENVYSACVVSAYKYDLTNGKYNVNPKVENVRNIETVTLKFGVRNGNYSAELNYDYSIQLMDQTNISSTVANTTNLKKVGNTYVATSTLATGNQLGYKVEGTKDYFEYAPVISNTNTVTSAIHVFGSGITALNIYNEAIQTAKFAIAADTYGGVKIYAADLSMITEDTYLPVAVNDSTLGVKIVTSIPGIGDGSQDWPAFGNTPLKITSLPGGLKSIGDYAFYECTSLQISNTPQGLTHLSACEVFKGCTGLTSLNMPAVNVIFNGSTSLLFEGCVNLETLYFGNLSEIPDVCFNGLSGLKNLIMDGELNRIGNYALSSISSLQKVVLPLSSYTVGYEAFYYCENLEEINLEGAVEFGVSLPSYDDTEAFVGCVKLKEVNLSNLEEIPSVAFAECSSLDTVTFSERLKSIGDYAFSNTGFQEISIPKVTSIGQYAFSNCNSLTTINFDGTKEDWDSAVNGEVVNPGVVVKFINGTSITIS